MTRSNKVSIIIPAYNEEKTILTLLTRLDHPEIAQHIEKIIVVDDGSIDNTKSVATGFRPQNTSVEVHGMEKNSGKAAAVRLGMLQAGDLVLIQDADLEYDPSNIPKLVAPLISGDAQFVFGTRLNPRDKNHYPINKYLIANYFVTYFVNLFGKQKITDAMTGYKGFHKSFFVASDCKEENFDQCVELTIKIVRSPLSIKEIPISYAPRNKSQGKKINLKDFFTVIRTVWKYRKW